VTGRAAFHPFQLARRGSVAFRIVAGVFILLTMAFFKLQILEHSEYELKSESNRLRPVPLVAPRGLILDRKGQIIAENVPGYTVSLLAADARSLQRMIDDLQLVLPLDSEQMRRIMQRYRAAPYEPTLIVKDAPFELVSQLEERRATIPGLVIQTEPKRYYPDSTAVAHLVGYVGEVTEQELAGVFASRRLGATVGKTGLERQYEDSLAGSDGVRFVEVDALGRVIREEGAQSLPTVPGNSIRTTIDLDLQRFIASIYPRQYRGAIVAMDPRSGAVLALYSHPAYDPNDFVGGVSSAVWSQLNTDPTMPLLNRAIGTRYPPASTFKLATALLGLQRGVVNFHTHMPIPCRGGMQIGNRYFRCWKAAGHGSLDLIGAVASSCDVYFYQLGLRLTVAGMSEGGTAIGFRAASGIDLPNELRSLYPSGTDYYDRVYGRNNWTNSYAANLSIGQGENAQTLINMVRFYATLANGGHVPTPFIVRERVAPPPPIPLADSLFLGLRRALIAVVEQGTARGSRLAGIQFAGKTGTAQNPHGADHGWFVGFAPADNPVIVVGGIFEFGLHGTTVAPYVARAVQHYITGIADSAGQLDVSPLRIPVDSAPRSIPLDSGEAGATGRPRRPAAVVTPPAAVVPPTPPPRR
jgi:penicillin-binding protein 2